MHFENVSILVNALATVLTDMKYCWRDKQGTICMQKGVFRVNCIDCLDRTNVVQTALGKAVMEMQFSKLGLIPPEGTLPTNIRQTFQLLWANNGDIISKQYAGTNALKVRTLYQIGLFHELTNNLMSNFIRILNLLSYWFLIAYREIIQEQGKENLLV